MSTAGQTAVADAIISRREAPQPKAAGRPRPRAWRVVILVVMAIFYVLPIGCAVKFSLINQKGTYGPQNYTAIVNNGALSDALVLSLEIAAITAGVAVLLVFPTAVLVRLKLPKLTIVMEAITILPIVVPPVVLAAGLLQMKETAPLWIVNDFFNHPADDPDADVRGPGDAADVPRDRHRPAGDRSAHPGRRCHAASAPVGR